MVENLRARDAVIAFHDAGATRAGIAAGSRPRCGPRSPGCATACGAPD